jgi:hypothetical protein
LLVIISLPGSFKMSRFLSPNLTANPNHFGFEKTRYERAVLNFIVIGTSCSGYKISSRPRVAPPHGLLSES